MTISLIPSITSCRFDNFPLIHSALPRIFVLIQSINMITRKSFLFLLPLLLSFSFCLNRFAMNKPHMLFQISSRQPVSLNTGWGYWSDQYNTTIEHPFRLKYQNDKAGLNCYFTQHDGESHFREEIRDTLYNVDSSIKYQSKDGETWEALIQMNNTRSVINGTGVNPFVYVVVENIDYYNIDKVGYHSDKRLAIDRSTSPPKILVFTKQILTEVIYIQTPRPIELVGLNANVSETWKTPGLINEFLNLVEMNRDDYTPKVSATSDVKLVQWQKTLLARMKKDDWEKEKYVLIMICARFLESSTIHLKHVKIGGLYEPFNIQAYNTRSQQLQRVYNGEQKQNFLQHVLFNLLGGIAYYYGPLYAQNSLLQKQQTVTYSTTPSRLIFPRCFLWDDGFHLTILADKHPQFSLKFLSQWIDKIDLFGWIARQQIRGFEVSSMLPDRSFVFQDSLEGNPPTLMLPIRYFLKHYPNHEGMRAILKKNMWKIQKWFRYFKTTQSHFDLTDVEEIDQDIKFRWRCKDSCQNGNFMGSGLDDYPRQDLHQLSKQHVDLISWLYFFSDSLEIISKHLGNRKGQKYYGDLKTFYNETLHKHYLDHRDQLFKDISVSDQHNINGFVTHVGYINLFPFMMGMVAQGTPTFKKIVEVMTDESILWSQSGLRSLSKSDPLYGTGDNYWRGAVWMPINYMVLRACKLYYPDSTKDLYERLKANLINVVQSNQQETGYLYENYHKGKGNRGYPFYGWTSLINPIILDLY